MFQQTICVDVSPLFSIIDGDPTEYIGKDARALHQDRKKSCVIKNRKNY
jgi:hypothetical protein